MSNDDLLWFEANGGEGPLLEHVQQVKRRDFADDDVRSVVRDLQERDHKLELAHKYGAAGVEKMVAWDSLLRQQGPNAVKAAMNVYQTAPRQPVAEPEEERNEDDWAKSARAAFKQASQKQSATDRDRAVADIERLSQDHGGTWVIDKFGRWHQQLSENPHDAAPRIAAEIASTANETILNQQAAKVVSDYKSKYQVSDAENAVMIRMLQRGEAHDLPTAHRQARYELALDEPDHFRRSVIAAQRATEAWDVHLAKQEVARWDATHPNVSKSTRNQMEKLLAAEKVQTLDEAYAAVTRK